MNSLRSMSADEEARMGRGDLPRVATMAAVVSLTFAVAAGAQASAEGGDSLRGELEPIAAHTDRDIDGHATLTRTGDGRTHLSLQATGLEPGASYHSHLHAGPCAEHGPHYQHDPDGADEPPNELWPSSDPHDPTAGLQANPAGNTSGRGTAPWRARDEALSVFLHDHDGTRVACADLS